MNKKHFWLWMNCWRNYETKVRILLQTNKLTLNLVRLINEYIKGQQKKAFGMTQLLLYMFLYIDEFSYKHIWSFNNVSKHTEVTSNYAIPKRQLPLLHKGAIYRRKRYVKSTGHHPENNCEDWNSPADYSVNYQKRTISHANELVISELWSYQIYHHQYRGRDHSSLILYFTIHVMYDAIAIV